jgi:hypothetical protein
MALDEGGLSYATVAYKNKLESSNAILTLQRMWR